MFDLETINPMTLKQALLAKSRRNVAAFAGGTDLMVRLHDMIDRPHPRLLVIDGIAALHKISSDNGKISIGPLITFTEIENSIELNKFAPQLVEAAILAGSSQIRNRATIGGNIANGSPAGDLIPPLYALGAKLELSSLKGKRQIAIEDFFLGPGKTILKPSELITKIYFDKNKNVGFFLRLATRQALAISKISVACSIAVERNLIVSIRIALGAVAPTVMRARATENFLIGKTLNAKNILQASDLAMQEARPIDDLRSTAEYRREMVGILLKRGLTQMASKSK